MPQPNSDLTAVSGLPKERVLLPFFAIVLLGGALLGPLLFLALRGLVPFHRTMDRALLIAALLALGSNWRRLNFSRWWRPNGLATRQALFGFVIALVSAQALLGLDLASGVRTWMPLDAHALAQLLGKTLIAALLVPLAEETIFRGFLQTELMHRIGSRAGWLLAAFIYMLAHFVKIPVELDHQPVHPWSGFRALGEAFLPAFQGAFLGGRGLNLLLLGLILGGTFWRSGRLWFNYGLHGGLIFSLLLLSGLTRPIHARGWNTDVLGSPLTTLVLLLLGLWLWRFYRRPLPEPETGANAL